MAGHPTLHVNVIKLKGEIEWKVGLPHLSEMQHLPGVPHLHVNRPLEGGLAGGKILVIHFTQQTSYTLLQTALAQFYFG